MPTTTQVTAGDLITADLMNEILQRLAAAEANAPSETTGTVAVPTVYGRTLTAARSVLVAPAQQLNLGSVLSTAGAIVDPNASGSASLLVIAQVPQPGTRVAPNTSVDVVVAASGSGGGSPSPVPAPVITSLSAASVPVLGQVTINGANFSNLPTSNVVRFNTTAATVSPVSSTTQLFVTVPSGIPGAPTAPGQPALPGVSVTVTVNGQTATASSPITITAPNPSAPTVTGTNQPIATATQPLTITGTNFSTTAAQNAVTIGGVNAPIVGSPTATSITVTVPVVSGLNAAGDQVNNVPLIVRVNSVPSNSFPISVFRAT